MPAAQDQSRPCGGLTGVRRRPSEDRQMSPALKSTRVTSLPLEGRGRECRCGSGVRIFSVLGTLLCLFPCGLRALCQNQQCGGCSSGMSGCYGSLQNNSRTNMLTSLLENYDSLMRPQFEAGEATTVICDVFINSVDSISVDNMDYSLNIYLRQSWLDPRLAFDGLYPNVSSLTLDTKLFDTIWVPDLFFPNEKASHSHCITMPNRLIRIYSNGTVWYSARYTLRLSCHMSLEYFPHDKQTCYLILESYGYTLSEIQFTWRNETPIQINENLELPQFELLGHQVNECKKSYITGNFTCLSASFFLHRKYGYYIIQNYVPSFLIVVLSWVSFWINIDAVPARISLGVLTVLTMTTQSVGVWMSLPRVSYVKAIDVWMSTCVMFVFIAMVEFAIVNTLARQEIRRMSLRVRADAKNGEGGNDVIKRVTDEYTYGMAKQFDPGSRMMARRVDKISRKLFPGIFVTFNIVYWAVCLIQKSF